MLRTSLIMFFLSISLFANEIFVKDAEQFKATVNFESDKDASKILIKAVPKKGWHINTGFPVSVKPENTVLQFDKKKYKKKDAKILKETELLFEIPAKLLEKEDLKKELKASVVLGVCTDKICKRVEFKINAPLKDNKEVKKTKEKGGKK